MTFTELMVKLADWITTTWNVAHPEHQIILQPVNSELTRFKVTPLSVPNYLLLSFREVYAAPPYQWIINLDRCKSYFGGVKIFEDFYHQVRDFLKKCSWHDEKIFKIAMKNLEMVNDLTYSEPQTCKPMLSIFNSRTRVTSLVDAEDIKRTMPAFCITHF